MDTQDSKTMQNNFTKVFTGVAQCDIMISEVKSGNKNPHSKTLKSFTKYFTKDQQCDIIIS